MKKTSRHRRARNTNRSFIQRALRSYWSWLGIGVILIAAGLLAMYWPEQPVIAQGIDMPGADAAPDFELVTADDSGTLRLSDFRGQYVLVNFWATWCPPCRAELPDLVNYYHRYADQGFMLIGVNEQESAATAAGFLEQQGLDFPVVLDSDGRVMNAYGVSGLPSSFLVNPQGQIVRMWTGMINRQTLESSVTPLLAAAG